MARRPPSRHARSIPRFTPRRWLPFLVLCGLVAAGVAVAAQDDGSDTGAPTPAERAMVPMVASDGALSSAAFCSGGSAQGEAGLAEMTLVIANDDPAGAKADITVYDQLGGHRSSTVDVPANGRARVAVAEIHGGAWVAATVEVRGGRAIVDREVRGPDGFDAAPCATSAAERWVVPSGSTLRGSEEYLSIFNPFPDSASVAVSFATETGRRSPRALRSLSVPGGSVRVIRVADTITNRAEIAATVRARSGRVVVDRVQTHDGNGDEVEGRGPDASTTPPPHGLVSTAGFPSTAPRWFFPGASLGLGDRTQLAVANPGAATVRVDVLLTYERGKEVLAVEPIELSVRAADVEVIDLTDQPGLQEGLPFTIDVEALDDAPVVAELLSFRGDPAQRKGAAAMPGSPLAARRWLVAQGGPTRQLSPAVVVANPGAASTEVKVVQITGGTRKALPGGPITIPAGDRRALDLSGASPAATLEISADHPVVVSYGLSVLDGVGRALALAQPFPESVVDIPESTHR